MIRAIRITKAKYANQAFTGQGGLFVSGRWHRKMVPMVYCSSTCSLATLEVFVNLQEGAKKIKFVSFEVSMPDGLVIDIESITSLPKRWRNEPPEEGTKKIGSDWARSMGSAVLSVPSATVPSERNYLLNPMHLDFSKVTINKAVPFSFDSRLWK